MMFLNIILRETSMHRSRTSTKTHLRYRFDLDLYLQEMGRAHSNL